MIYAVAFAYGAVNVLIGAGQAALLTTLMPEHLLVDANGFLQTVREGLRLVAPLIGAGLFAAFGAGVLVVLDASTFVVAAVALLALRVARAGAGAATADAVAPGRDGRGRPPHRRRARAAADGHRAGHRAAGHRAVREPDVRGGRAGDAAAAGVPRRAARRAGRGRRRGRGHRRGDGAARRRERPDRGRHGRLRDRLRVDRAGRRGVAAADLRGRRPVRVRPAVDHRRPGDAAAAPDAAGAAGPRVHRRRAGHRRAQTLSIAAGALLVGLVDYRLLLALIAVVVAGAGVFLVSERTPRLAGSAPHQP